MGIELNWGKKGGNFISAEVLAIDWIRKEVLGFVVFFFCFLFCSDGVGGWLMSDGWEARESGVAV